MLFNFKLASDQNSDARKILLARKLSLKENFSWTFLGNVIYAASQWGMLVTIAKLGTPENVGQFTLGFALSAPIIIFSMLGLRQFQATDVKNEYQFRDYLRIRLITNALAFVMLAAITRLSGYQSETMMVILMIGLAKCIEAVSDICLGLFQKHERMDRVAISFIAKSVLSLPILSITFFITRSVLWASAGLVISWLFVLVGFDLQNVRKILKTSGLEIPRSQGKRYKFDFNKAIHLVFQTLPLGIASSLITLNSNIPRYLIENHLGERSLGLFASMVYLLYASNTVVSALGQSASPRLAKYYACQDVQKYKYLLLKLVVIGFLLGVVGILGSLVFGKGILTFFYRAEYAENNVVLTWIMLAGCVSFMSSFLGYGMTASRSIRVQPFIYALLSLLSFSIGSFIIPRYGFIGGAWLLLIIGIIQLLITSVVNIIAVNRLKVLKAKTETKTAAPS